MENEVGRSQEKYEGKHTPTEYIVFLKNLLLIEGKK